ncbi:MAG: TlpA family protein disulfide reductase [Ruminococcaceae bacterium]|nr:TlpA family protein disulfide reductase [Oscillospiraceae bacterium]
MENENKPNFFQKIGEIIKKKKLLFIILACVLVLAIAAGVLAVIFLGGDSPLAGPGDKDKNNKDNFTYTVNLKTKGGMALSEIDVYIYEADDLKDLNTYAKTDSEGRVTFNLPENDKYAIVLIGVPDGYNVKESYAFKDNKANIVLESSLITDKSINDAKSLGLGDVMYDFTLMDSTGKEVKLSEMMKGKDLVVLNFWFSTCSPCLSEFPVMNEVYEEYKENVDILAINPHPTDNAESVKAFHQQNGYSFKMAAAPNAWSALFGVSGYPTSVFVDRYGVICLVEVGAITSKRPFVSAFDHFVGDDYEQKLCANIGELITQVKPTYEMPASEEIESTINKGSTITYRAETEDKNAEYIWPFILGEKNGEKCIYASNIGFEETSAIIYADVTLKKGQALGIDYLVSSERLNDNLYVIVNKDDIFQISGVSSPEQWKSCYPIVADEDGTYEVALCYIKDSDTNDGDDTVYIKGMRVVDASAIDVETFLPRYAATTKDDGETYSYVDIVLSPVDGYYHIGKADGPILLADLEGFTQFNEEESLSTLVASGDADKDGVSLYNWKKDGGLGMVQYFSYASNSALRGVCPVNEELAGMLKQVAEVAGFDSEDPNEWLRACKYFEAFGPGATQFADPIKGVAITAPLSCTLGKDVATNYFYYDRAIHPRGMYAKFVPTQSGVYRFTSKSDYADGIDAWIFDKDGNNIYTYEHDERMYTDMVNCSMVYYMEAGTPYYINMAFWDIYATGYIYYDVEFLGSTIEFFRLCSPGYFTYDANATGEEIYAVIAGGIKPELRDDGLYHESVDGSIIYADFIGTTGVFSQSISQMIEMGGFDFSKSETDGEILAYIKQNGGDLEKTDDYLKTLWGEDYEANYDLYMVDDIFDGRYHGEGEDYTEEMRTYLAKMDKSGSERDGCVPVDARLAEILQLLLDKYTFDGVKNSWIKVCYYYDYLGPAK